MGRSIPSISNRLDAKLAELQHFAKTLRGKDREAFEEIVKDIRDHRTEIDALNEPDLTGTINFMALVNLKREINEHNRPKDGLSNPGRLD
ncbi:hypothetical protein HY994_02120 [Candidatus Micrarchaeota archaeon]|nr:hypothetical protein [Candidatus Micrarchaeota archaeon]